jgi:hypothetical protein
MIDPLPTTVHLTRREALAAERRHQAGPHRTISATRPVAVLQPAAPAAARRPAVRTATLPLVGAAAALLMFMVNTTPAVAAAGTPTTTGPVTVIAPHGQTFNTGSTGVVVAARDSYSVTAPAPRPAVVSSVISTSVGTSSTANTAVAAPSAPSTGAGLVRRPFPGLTKISSPFGYRSAPCAGCTSFHEGTDLTPGAGTPIGAVAAGTVAVSGWHSNYGQYVIIEHLIDGRKISSLYGHMQAGSTPLCVGDTVAVGAFVGRVGNTGISTGAHLHLEIRLDGTLPVDPMIWLAAHGA